MSIVNALAGIAVKDIEAALLWYEQILGPASRPMEEVAEWQLPHGGCVQVFEDGVRAGYSSMTLMVEDLDREGAHFHVMVAKSAGFRHGESPPARARRVGVAVIARWANSDACKRLIPQGIPMIWRAHGRIPGAGMREGRNVGRKFAHAPAWHSSRLA